MFQVITRVPFPVSVPVENSPDHISSLSQVIKDDLPISLDRPFFQHLDLLIALIKLQDNRGCSLLHVHDNIPVILDRFRFKILHELVVIQPVNTIYSHRIDQQLIFRFRLPFFLHVIPTNFQTIMFQVKVNRGQNGIHHFQQLDILQPLLHDRTIKFQCDILIQIHRTTNPRANLHKLNCRNGILFLLTLTLGLRFVLVIEFNRIRKQHSFTKRIRPQITGLCHERIDLVHQRVLYPQLNRIPPGRTFLDIPIILINLI